MSRLADELSSLLSLLNIQPETLPPYDATDLLQDCLSMHGLIFRSRHEGLSVTEQDDMEATWERIHAFQLPPPRENTSMGGTDNGWVNENGRNVKAEPRPYRVDGRYEWSVSYSCLLGMSLHIYIPAADTNAELHSTRVSAVCTPSRVCVSFQDTCYRVRSLFFASYSHLVGSLS